MQQNNENEKKRRSFISRSNSIYFAPTILRLSWCLGGEARDFRFRITDFRTRTDDLSNPPCLRARPTELRWFGGAPWYSSPWSQHDKHAGSLPKRTDIHSILIVGSGPIVIGQACEFDIRAPRPARCSGKRLSHHPREFESCHDHDRPGAGRPDLHRTHHTQFVEAIIEREKPDALLPPWAGRPPQHCRCPGRKRSA